MQIQLFAGLSPADAAEVHAATERIKLRMKRTAEDIIAIGQDLIEVKAKLGHGRFGEWLSAEFGMTDRTAQRFMQVADHFGGKSDTVSLLPLKALYELAAPSTPEPVRQEVVAKVEAGESVTAKEVQEWKRRYQEAQTAADQAKHEASSLSRLLADANNKSPVTSADPRVPQLEKRIEALNRDSARLADALADAEAEREALQKALRGAMNVKPDTTVADKAIDEIRQQEAQRFAVNSLAHQAKAVSIAVQGFAGEVAEVIKVYPSAKPEVCTLFAAVQKAIDMLGPVMAAASQQDGNIIRFGQKGAAGA